MGRAVKILERITKQVIKEFWRKAASQEGDPKLPLGGMRVPPNIWFHASPYPKRHLDRFIRFSTAHGYVQQTYTHRPRNIGSNMLHLCTTCMRCGLIAGQRPQWVRHTDKPSEYSVGGHCQVSINSHCSVDTRGSTQTLRLYGMEHDMHNSFPSPPTSSFWSEKICPSADTFE